MQALDERNATRAYVKWIDEQREAAVRADSALASLITAEERLTSSFTRSQKATSSCTAIDLKCRTQLDGWTNLLLDSVHQWVAEKGYHDNLKLCYTELQKATQPPIPQRLSDERRKCVEFGQRVVKDIVAARRAVQSARSRYEGAIRAAESAAMARDRANEQEETGPEGPSQNLVKLIARADSSFKAYIMAKREFHRAVEVLARAENDFQVQMVNFHREFGEFFVQSILKGVKSQIQLCLQHQKVMLKETMERHQESFAALSSAERVEQSRQLTESPDTSKPTGGRKDDADGDRPLPSSGSACLSVPVSDPSSGGSSPYGPSILPSQLLPPPPAGVSPSPSAVMLAVPPPPPPPDGSVASSTTDEDFFAVEPISYGSDVGRSRSPTSTSERRKAIEMTYEIRISHLGDRRKILKKVAEALRPLVEGLQSYSRQIGSTAFPDTLLGGAGRVGMRALNDAIPMLSACFSQAKEAIATKMSQEMDKIIEEQRDDRNRIMADFRTLSQTLNQTIQHARNIKTIRADRRRLSSGPTEPCSTTARSGSDGSSPSIMSAGGGGGPNSPSLSPDAQQLHQQQQQQQGVGELSESDVLMQEISECIQSAEVSFINSLSQRVQELDVSERGRYLRAITSFKEGHRQMVNSFKSAWSVMSDALRHLETLDVDRIYTDWLHTHLLAPSSLPSLPHGASSPPSATRRKSSGEHQHHPRPYPYNHHHHQQQHQQEHRLGSQTSFLTADDTQTPTLAQTELERQPSAGARTVFRRWEADQNDEREEEGEKEPNAHHQREMERRHSTGSSSCDDGGAPFYSPESGSLEVLPHANEHEPDSPTAISERAFPSQPLTDTPFHSLSERAIPTAELMDDRAYRDRERRLYSHPELPIVPRRKSEDTFEADGGGGGGGDGEGSGEGDDPPEPFRPRSMSEQERSPSNPDSPWNRRTGISPAERERERLSGSRDGLPFPAPATSDTPTPPTPETPGESNSDGHAQSVRKSAPANTLLTSVSLDPCKPTPQVIGRSTSSPMVSYDGEPLVLIRKESSRHSHSQREDGEREREKERFARPEGVAGPFSLAGYPAANDVSVPESGMLEAEEEKVKFTVRAVKPFASEDGEFRFKENDMVSVTVPVGETWEGLTSDGVPGSFPANCVEVPADTIWAQGVLEPEPAPIDRFFQDLFGTGKKPFIPNASSSSHAAQVTPPSATQSSPARDDAKRTHMSGFELGEGVDALSPLSDSRGGAGGHDAHGQPARSVSLHSHTESLDGTSAVTAVGVMSSAEDEEFRMRFHVDGNVVQSYACALNRKILLQGRMYITRDHIGFFSIFNDNTLFGGDTAVLIHFNDVVAITKKWNALIFPNSIEIELADGTAHFFASFMTRDRAYDLLTQIWMGRQTVRLLDGLPAPVCRSGSFKSDHVMISRLPSGTHDTLTADGPPPDFVRQADTVQPFPLALSPRALASLNTPHSLPASPISAPARPMPPLPRESPPLTASDPGDAERGTLAGAAAAAEGIEMQTMLLSGGDEGGQARDLSPISRGEGEGEGERDRVMDARAVEMAPAAPVLAQVPLPAAAEPCPTEPLKYVVPGAIWKRSIRRVFDILFNSFDKPNSFYHRLLHRTKAWDYRLPGWDPPPPPPFGKGDPLGKRPTRCVTYKRAVRRTALTALLSLPEQCVCTETYKLFVYSARCFLVDVRVQISDMPLADCFEIHTRYKFVSVGDEGEGIETQLDADFQVDFVKNTMLKGKIESEAVTEFRDINLPVFIEVATACLAPPPTTRPSPILPLTPTRPPLPSSGAPSVLLTQRERPPQTSALGVIMAPVVGLLRCVAAVWAKACTLCGVDPYPRTEEHAFRRTVLVFLAAIVLLLVIIFLELRRLVSVLEVVASGGGVQAGGKRLEEQLSMLLSSVKRSDGL
ncbi:unnamed protein product [Vitrella brassicaformis CCMP3155]|uniref:VASt domain-containing protein n=2 Tax=Vitrella brassicaformis TaxID=1169539 RepID=A0A0G4F639_VITBC|nr:unnamed protein product [Vitrella brassicaformis CCMP3155]|eukprot:CEM07563.1 unnamed protein product [Vitrella brassicaformis CCMP3155]